MRVRLNSSVHLKSSPDADGMAWLQVKVIDEDDLIVDIDGERITVAAETPENGDHWTLIQSISPKYLRGATVEIIAPDPRIGWKVKLIQTVRPMPRNAQFARTFTVRRNHLASRV